MRASCHIKISSRGYTAGGREEREPKTKGGKIQTATTLILGDVTGRASHEGRVPFPTLHHQQEI